MTSRLKKRAPIIAAGLGSAALGVAIYLAALSYFLSEEQDRLASRNTAIGAATLKVVVDLQAWSIRPRP